MPSFKLPWHKKSEELEFKNQIKSEKDWQLLCNSPVDCSFANTETVKCIVDIRPASNRIYNGKPVSNADPQATIYFLQSEKYNWHFGFAKKYLLTRKAASNPYAHHRFNETQYLKEERDYVLGSLVRYKDQNKVCFELWAGDNFDAERFAKVFAVINERVNLGEKLYYRPMSQDQETRIAPVVEKNGFEIVTAKELFGNIRYQALTNGECVGKLRFIRVADQHKARPVRSFEILVMDQIANELPLCGGLITSVVQTPLCHTALLSQNRGTPNMALVGVCDEKLDKDLREQDRVRIKKLLSLNNKWVKLRVRQQDFDIEQIDKQEAVALLKRKAKAAAKEQVFHNLIVNNEIDKIVPIPCMMKTNLHHSIGAKASQLSKLALLVAAFDNEYKLDLLPIAGFVLPFHFYTQFMHEINGFKVVKDAEEALQAQEKQVSATNDDFYKSIQSNDVFGDNDEDDEADDDHDDDDDENALEQLNGSRFLLTSSFQFDDGVYTTAMKNTVDSHCQKLVRLISNASDDSPALNSAANLILEAAKARFGDKQALILRSSTNVEDLPGFNGAGLYDSVKVDKIDLKQIKNAIRKCYASMWTYRCFSERAAVGIHQKDTAMALLVQEYADDIVANGVAISLIPFRKDFPGVYINAQFDDVKVTDGAHAAEQIVVYDENDGTVEIVARSSLNSVGTPVLSQQEAQRIYKILMKLPPDAFGGGSSSNALDVEFVLIGKEKRGVLLLQCRPCSYH